MAPLEISEVWNIVPPSNPCHLYTRCCLLFSKPSKSKVQIKCITSNRVWFEFEVISRLYCVCSVLTGSWPSFVSPWLCDAGISETEQTTACSNACSSEVSSFNVTDIYIFVYWTIEHPPPYINQSSTACYNINFNFISTLYFVNLGGSIGWEL